MTLSSSQPQPRTNSLAFAKTDCHTCAAHHRKCDRRRPQCSPCLDNDILCGGFPMQLSWSGRKPAARRARKILDEADDPFYLEPLSLKMASQFRDREKRHCSKPRAPQQFKFVANEPSIRKRPFRQSGKASSHPQPSPSKEPQDPEDLPQGSRAETGLFDHSTPRVQAPGTPDKRGEGRLLLDSPDMNFLVDLEVDNFGPWSWSPTPYQGPKELLGAESDVDMDLSTGAELGSGCDDSYLSDSYNMLHSRAGTGEDGTSELSWPQDPARLPCLPTPPSTDSPLDLVPLDGIMLYEGLFEKFGGLLDMYDREFCVLPLSRDIQSNPFRCRSQTSQGSQFLLHAILALSCYHTTRQPTIEGTRPSADVVDHQNTAIQLYRKELENYHGAQGVRLLDTTLVLFTLNATQSAFGDWISYISDAQKLLSIAGGIRVWENNPRAQAQVVMLLWWDATIGLLSREGCMLPYSYLEALLPLENHRSWSFFDVTGCPRQLVVPLIQLASLAEEKEKAASMRWTRFDLTLVDEIQQSIINWKNPGLEFRIEDDSMSEEQLQRQRDIYHCSEAWRYGLLIYITRVFYWNRHDTPPRKLAYYARLTIEHVNSCRNTAPIQRQVLLALFFAGCETRDACLRQSIRDYCLYWSTHSGYQLFATASTLLEELWTEGDESGDKGVWWGSVIDAKQKSQQQRTQPMRFCFG
ncbi:hypothetical protein A1O3_06928 [Capronia epimyces CBS 606.96]|uniref:Zn(2)-C6 fungal-type domain-containing protein n=1 Tax=Capronia epimyces CBS 606.96 TaxID=1182542 RepID=W9YEA5_9EURO|nr:uncharacterized protein A1O3_06928 [Capronia epimyces CBS 606.96]EXJ80644.1 hypothetical protein A1O3_06928 [Capronia epimyces CBS 606.96]